MIRIVNNHVSGRMAMLYADGEWGIFGACNHCRNIIEKAVFADCERMPVCPECGMENDVSSVTAKIVDVTKWYHFTARYEWRFKGGFKRG